jgi:hypothetical protein
MRDSTVSETVRDNAREGKPYPLLDNMLGVQQRDSSKLKPKTYRINPTDSRGRFVEAYG